MTAKLAPAALTACAALACAVMALPARAGFIDQRSKAPVLVASANPSADPSVAAATVAPGALAGAPAVDLPTGGVWAQTTRGFGRDESVFDALTALLPKGYRLSYDMALPAKTVSWEGGDRRADVIRNVLRQAGYGAHLEDRDLVVDAPAASGPAPAGTDSTGSGVGAAAGAASAGNPSTWVASEADGNLRVAMERWAAQAKWKVVWDYGQDLPLAASDSATGDFKDAVRQLLSSTDMMDTPLKPCFYSNNVVRVAPVTVKCDPNQ
ncbi:MULTISPECIES: toxin co-regulated pilus biosynthesis Q family protein [unclassified Burkholderia]|uniref:toxin co-regulated pilus biosynthesis Q family protein n=1 Tax=unclassified Burkholderia TaxID=2613784 RepID=UPI002AB068DB|nr:MULTISPECIES: toxin co-regulated pilus biosynthesis Q family protein [unclassified Burkholderia]